MTFLMFTIKIYKMLDICLMYYAKTQIPVVHTGKVFNDKLILMFVKLYLSAARDREKKTPIV